LDGRVLSEALVTGPDPAQVSVETRRYAAQAGDYRAGLQVSLVGGRRYVDQSWRAAPIS
jgi:hypothetical protein